MSKRSTKEVTASKIAEMQRLVYEQNMDRGEVAAKLHVAPSTVYKYAPVRRPNASKMLVAVDIVDPMANRRQLVQALEPVTVAAQYMDRSLKQHILLTLVERGPFKGVVELVDAMRGTGARDNFGPHEVTTLLHSLSKQEMVRFRQSKNVPGVADMMLTNISATDRAFEKLGVQQKLPPPLESRLGVHPPGYSRQRHAAGKDMTEQRYHGSQATGGPVETTVIRASNGTRVEVDVPAGVDVVAVRDNYIPPQTVQEPTEVPSGTPAPLPMSSRLEADGWPHLARLQKEAERAESVAEQATKLMEAAELLAEADPEAAQQMLERADKLVGPAFTPEQAEYLRFAALHLRREG
jgi:hypothetical protein